MTGNRYKAYIYPSDIRNDGKQNIYIRHFIESCSKYYEFVNKNQPPRAGLFDIVKYCNKIDILFLNWPEEVPERKGGTLQAIFYILLINFLKLKGVIVCWTLHNKVSHVKGKNRLKQFLRKFSAQKADYIITHAKEGLQVFRNLTAANDKKIKFFHHPVLPAIELKENKIKYDILIWGLVAPYKGVDKFLEFIHRADISNLRIAIAGKIEGSEYRDTILTYKNENISIFDRFISENELGELISASRMVLFTYLDYSILSSGALMDTLRYMPLIVGPSCGAFNDLREEGLIFTYTGFDDLKNILLDRSINIPNRKKIKEFVNSNSWADFSRNLSDFIKIKAE